MGKIIYTKKWGIIQFLNWGVFVIGPFFCGIYQPLVYGAWINYGEAETDFNNPEQGFWRTPVIRNCFKIPSYDPLTQDFLNEIEKNFDGVRNAKMKIVPRFSCTTLEALPDDSDASIYRNPKPIKGWGIGFETEKSYLNKGVFYESVLSGNLHLSMQDPASSLQGISEYASQLAVKEVWEPAKGLDSLRPNVKISSFGNIPLTLDGGLKAKIKKSNLRISQGLLSEASLEISFNNATAKEVRIIVHDIFGRVLDTLVNSKLEKGEHLYFWNRNLKPPGVYFISFHRDSKVEHVKVLVK